MNGVKQVFNGSLPIQATEIAADWDLLYWAMMAISVFFFVLVIGLMVYFAWKYRERPGNKPVPISHNLPLEIIWTAVPTVLLLVIFGWGWIVYKKMIEPPGDAYEIRVVGKQWLWQFLYEDGRSTTNELYVPAHRPVKLVMTSDDVLHSFFIPAFRVKQDVVPGMYTSVWFEATIPGEHIVYCAEYCGTAHSNMLAKVIALEEQDWKRWQRGKKIQLVDAKTKAHQGISLVDRGSKLMAAKGCVACHTADGTKRIGPSYKGLFGSKRKLSDGSVALADENYIRESIENPEVKKVQGYEGLIMPTFKGQLNEREMTAVIAYIKSLK